MIHVFDSIILLLIPPKGFIVFVFLIFLEYLTVNSILKDPNKINLKTIFSYMRNSKPKGVPLTASQRTVLDIIFRNENISIKEISENIGIKVGITRKLIGGLAGDGYVTRKINTNDRREFYYMTSNKFQ